MFAPHELSPRLRNAAAAAIHRCWEWITAVGAVGPDDVHGKRFRHFGFQSMMAFPPGALFGQQWISIGDHVLVGPHVSMSVGIWGEPRDESGPVVIDIGDGSNIGRGTSIVGRERIAIGKDVTTGPGVYITDHNHSYADPDTPITHQFPVSAPVEIGAGTWLGAGAIVLPGTTIGRNVTVAGGSVVRGDVPDHSVIAGVPARVVRRFVDGQWDPPLPPQDDPPDWWPKPDQPNT